MQTISTAIESVVTDLEIAEAISLAGLRADYSRWFAMSELVDIYDEYEYLILEQIKDMDFTPNDLLRDAFNWDLDDIKAGAAWTYIVTYCWDWTGSLAGVFA